MRSNESLHGLYTCLNGFCIKFFLTANKTAAKQNISYLKLAGKSEHSVIGKNEIKKQSRCEPPYPRWVGGPGPAGGAATSAAVVGPRPPPGEASLQADRMITLKRLHILVFLHLAGLLERGRAPSCPDGASGAGAPSDKEPGPGRPASA